jgi:broad specificity phosphatase PhoE
MPMPCLVRPIARRLLLGASLAVLSAAGGRSLHAQSAPAAVPAPLTVHLVRHAEKAAEPGSDPALSAEGQARAAALGAALRDAGVSAVVVTQFKRTANTAAVLAERARLTPQVVAAAADARAHAADVAAAVRRQPAGAVVLVVGHSNTVPAIIAALGGPRMPDLCDAEYDNLFTLTVPPAGPTRLVRARYGARAGAEAPTCAAMRTP